MASSPRHGFSLQQWPGAWDGTVSMRGECAISGRGAEFLPRASARHCLTFPRGVFSAHRVSSGSCPHWPNRRDFQQVTISTFIQYAGISWFFTPSANRLAKTAYLWWMVAFFSAENFFFCPKFLFGGKVEKKRNKHLKKWKFFAKLLSHRRGHLTGKDHLFKIALKWPGE